MMELSYKGLKLSDFRISDLENPAELNQLKGIDYSVDLKATTSFNRKQ